MSCQEPSASLFVSISATVFPEDIKCLFTEFRRALGSSVEQYKAALQHVREWEDLQKKECEVMSTLEIVIVQLQHIQAASSLKTLLYSISGTDSYKRDAFYPSLPHLRRFVLSCTITMITFSDTVLRTGQ